MSDAGSEPPALLGMAGPVPRPALSDAALMQSYAAETRAGVGRLDVEWRLVERDPVGAPGGYVFDAVDAQVAALAGAGIAPLLALNPGHPALNDEGARDANCPARGAAVVERMRPNDLTKVRGFARALAARFANRVRLFQVGDEPDTCEGWSGRGLTFVDAARAAIQGIREAQPAALIALGGMGSAYLEGVVCPPATLPAAARDHARGAVDAVLNEAAQSDVNALASHHYHQARCIPQLLAHVREKMRSAGTERPVWVTASAGPPTSRPVARRAGACPSEQDASYLSQQAADVAARAGQALGGGVRLYLWARWVGGSPTAGDPPGGASGSASLDLAGLFSNTGETGADGLPHPALGPDGMPCRKPAYHAFAQLAQMLSGATGATPLEGQPAGAHVLRIHLGGVGPAIHLAWGDREGLTVSVPVSATRVRVTPVPTVVDGNGMPVTTAPSVVSAQDGRVTLNVGSVPVWVQEV